MLRRGPTQLLTQSWLADLAVRIGRLLGLPGTLSLVILGLLSSIIAAAAITAIVLGRRHPRRTRLFVAAGLLLVVADSAFFGYFAAILGEGAAFLGLLLAAGGLLLTAREGRWSHAGVAVTFVGGVLAVNAKVQTLIILPILALGDPAGPAGVRCAGPKRWASAVLVIGAIGAVTLYAQQSVEPARAPDGTYTEFPGDDSREINGFNSIFLNIVDGRHDTRADLAELGLPPSFAQYAGNGWWHPHPATMDPLYAQYRDKVSRLNVLTYFATHPGRTLEVLDRAATDQLTARPDYLGSFDQSRGFPAARPGVPGAGGVVADRPDRPARAVRARADLAVRAGQGLVAATDRAGGRVGVPARRLGDAVGISALGDGIEGIKHQSVALVRVSAAIALVFVFFPAEPPFRTYGPVTLPDG